MEYKNTEEFALKMDQKDPLAKYREQFHMPKQSNGEKYLYFSGNSLGLQPKKARLLIEQELKDWEVLGSKGHVHAKNPWIDYGSLLKEPIAKLVGANLKEVVCMNSLTTNLHLMLVSFYRPNPLRHKILIEHCAFSSDQYAVKSQISFHGFDPKTSLLELKPRSGEDFIRTEDIESLIQKEGDSIALILVGGVNYFTGQYFDLERITKAGHEKGCVVGFDLAHAIGNVILHLHDWDVDFAVWCTYKYLNAGPGSVGGCFVHEKHAQDSKRPRFAGWWGHNRERRFLMEPDFSPMPGADGWQLSNVPIFSMAALRASMEIFDEVGMKAIRKKGDLLTGYLEYLIKQNPKNNLSIITPLDPKQRGCQLSLRMKSNGKRVHERLLEKDVICDWREPDAIRVTPIPLYTRFIDVYQLTQILFST